MRIMLDDRECDAQADTLGEAIAAAADLAEQRGRVIVQVHVDGKAWSNEQLQSPESIQATAEEVRLVSADPLGLLRQVLSEASAALDETDTIQREAAEHIQADRHQEAMDRLGEALSIWSSIREAVSLGAQVLDIDLEQEMIGSTPAPRIIERLNEQLRAIRDALQRNDPIGLADTLLYELPETVVQWQQMFAHLLSRIDGGDP